MVFIGARIVDGVPECPICGSIYPGRIDEFGVENDLFWFAFLCDKCSTSRRNLYVKWMRDFNLNIYSDLKESDIEKFRKKTTSRKRKPIETKKKRKTRKKKTK